MILLLQFFTDLNFETTTHFLVIGLNTDSFHRKYREAQFDEGFFSNRLEQLNIQLLHP